MFKRKIYDDLLAWKKRSQGTTALLIEGARRVGKSTVAEHFAKNEYKSYMLIDFSRASEEVLDLFEDLSDIDYLFLRLQLIYRKELHVRESLIIFDEVQFCPKARQAIKHLVKDGRYDYLETGSLISIRKNVKDILIPSEEESLQMYPMDYEEFCWAQDDTVTVPTLRTFYEEKKPLGNQLNRRMLQAYRLYMLVGGMPQAIQEYLDSKNFRAVDQVKRNILTLYQNDFFKIDQTGRIAALFESIPAELEKHTSRYQVSSVLPNDRANSIMSLLAEMESSKTILLAHHANDPNVGLSRTINADIFKLYAADTGLFTTLIFKDRDFTENIIYEKLLSDKLSTNLGYLYENSIAQTLSSKGYRLFYYTFRPDSGRNLYEVDFLLPDRNKLKVIEVKSSGYRRHASLDAFSAKYAARISEKIVIYTKDLKREQDITYLPIYMTQFL